MDDQRVPNLEEMDEQQASQFLKDGVWKVVHRHADPITTPQPAESVIQG